MAGFAADVKPCEGDRRRRGEAEGGDAILRTISNISAIFGLALALVMLIPALVDYAGEDEDWRVFVRSSAIVSSVCALVVAATRGQRAPFTQRLGFLLVTSVWLASVTVCAIPFYFSSVGLTLAGAFFESMSGLTTTGSTVISGLDALPPGILVWRSLLQWIGGIGIIGMVILILPSLGAGGLSLFQMESSDRSEKLLPRVSQLSAGLIAVFVVMTVLCVITYRALGMSLFDAVNHAMTTVATAGFSTHDASMGYFDDPAILFAATVFMILGALPIVLYLRAFMPRRLRNWHDPQIKLFLGLCVILSFCVALTRRFLNETPFGEALVSSTFNLVSILTTTGYASEDYTLWSNAAVGFFFLASFLGGCAGSTTGGVKSYRLVILFLLIRSRLRALVRPHAVQRMKYGNNDVSEQVIQVVTIYLFLFFGVLMIGTLALMSLGLDQLTAFSGTLTALANVGPGFGQLIGPAGNFASLSDPVLWILAAIMLIGRLEIVTVLILLFPPVWTD